MNVAVGRLHLAVTLEQEPEPRPARTPDVERAYRRERLRREVERDAEERAVSRLLVSGWRM